MTAPAVYDNSVRIGYARVFNRTQDHQAQLDAIWRKSEPGWHVCGTPDAFYTDHGSDFTSRHLEQVAIDLKIPWCSPGRANPVAAAR